MSTLPIRITNVPQFSLLGGFNRVFSVIVTVFDVLSEARQQAAAAHKRYPFADW